ncbi:hypothetical protein [Psychromonas sp. SP041]|uniref:hypothetical protein n=1 Tax=Psychromonas sp. SP041 TaxID=1365007 RepID=UPI0010C7B846|nr:hypothetical protein [Psychromonas sp. SP041]
MIEDKKSKNSLNKNIEDTAEQQTQSPPISKKKKRSVILSAIMGLLTIGVWNRIFPRNKGTKGSWAYTSIILFSITSAFICQKYFRAEINTMFKDVFAVDFELVDKSDKEELLTKIHALNDSTQRLYSKIDLINSDLIEMTEKYNKYYGLYSISLDQYSKVSEKLMELTNNPKVVVKYLEPEISLISFDKILSEVGCNSNFSEQKRLDIFKEKYQGKWVNWSGVISSATNSTVLVNGKSSSGFSVEFKEQNAGYDLMTNEPISLTFKLATQGNCDIPFTGHNGYIE